MGGEILFQVIRFTNQIWLCEKNQTLSEPRKALEA